MRKFIIAAAAVAAALPGMAQAAAFTNGSFELGTNPGSFSNVVTGDSTTITGWTVTAGDIDYIGSYWPAQTGARNLDLSGGGAGTIAQTFDTIAGTTYRINFAMSANPANGPNVAGMNVFATGGVVTPYSYSTAANGTTLSNMQWAMQAYTFTATGAATTLSFASTTSGSFGPALDSVSVTAVNAIPEPGTWAMLVIGFGAAGGMLRRRGDGTFARA